MTPDGGSAPVERLLADHDFWLEAVELMVRDSAESPVRSFLLRRVDESKRIAGAVRLERTLDVPPGDAGSSPAPRSVEAT